MKEEINLLETISNPLRLKTNKEFKICQNISYQHSPSVKIDKEMQFYSRTNHL
jgi:hypothetical protein